MPVIVMMVTGGARQPPADGASGPRIDSLVAAAARAARAGATMIQVRERGLDDRALVDASRSIVGEASRTSAKVVINDRLDVALAAGAHGVHLPSHGVDARRVRGIAPEGFLIGRSVHGDREALEVAQAGGCDYLVFGTVFESASKPSVPAAGVDALARVCASVALPVIAIGGITPERAREVARAGAAGVAAIGLFAIEDDRQLRARIQQIEDAFAAG